MKFSLIIATKGRVEPLRRLFDSLANSHHKDFEAVVVDQNPAGMLDAVIRDYVGSFSLRHVRTTVSGLSRARNVGLSLPLGDLVAFPDDDCFFDPWSLSTADEVFSRDSACGVFLGSLHLPQEASDATRGEPIASAIPETRTSLFRSAGSVVQFFRRDVVVGVGSFDETLGAGSGSPWGSGEDTDYLVRAWDKGAVIRRCPSIRVYHPEVSFDVGDPTLARKAFAYGRGRMKIIRKHGLPRWFALLNIVYLIPMIVMSPRSARYRWYLLRGRLYEWVKGSSL
jgi:glycosyltransferase involved in cell wall biosynthesis